MATTAANPNTTTTTPATSSAAADHSPRHSTTDINHPVNSPQSRRGGTARSVSSPWTQIVRGESESIPAAVTAAPAPAAPSSSPPPSSSAVEQQQPSAAAMAADSSSPSAAAADEGAAENENGPVGGNAGKRPAWNRPSNGAVEIGPVMGAVSWPALSESARVSTKSSSSDSLKGLSDGSSSTPVAQGTGTAASTSQKQHSHTGNSSSAPSHPAPTRQRSMKRNGANTSSNGGTTQPPGSQGAGGDVPLNSPSSGEHGQRSSQSRGGNDHPLQQQRNSFRNRNGGPHSRDGSHYQNYGGRRDQERGNHDWNSHRNFNNRDAYIPPQRGTPRFPRHPPPPPPPPATTPFVAPPPVRPFAGPMGFPELTPMYYVAATPPDSLRAVPFVPMAPPVYYSGPDFQLYSKIVDQIDYYFSNENLIKDTFLRQNMDDQGWVPIKLIAGFKKVSLLTDNVQLILESIKSSNMVEVQGDKVRRRNDWGRWIMPTTVQFPDVTGPRSPGNSSPGVLPTHVQSLSIEDRVLGHDSAKSQVDGRTEGFLSRSTSGDSNNQLQFSDEGKGDVGVQGVVDRHSMRRNSSK
ncbi:hypothetical protein Tsubulata_027293 [Turnera subulata]|uniref:HTH La-type RNA-binding domain-containing protein n=1 Tax=Turnera subulata TaxID=218843 RepID=A0A9Q0JHY7_9ROSI|nr:hypothetical protein Tsubulata_027293 [Turnera subulata]